MTNSPSSVGLPGSGPDRRTRIASSQPELRSRRGTARSCPVLGHPQYLPAQAKPSMPNGHGHQARPELDKSWRLTDCLEGRFTQGVDLRVPSSGVVRRAHE
jgi:hypothetical protein